LGACGDQVDRIRRYEHGRKAHCPICQFGGDGGQEDVDGDHCGAADPHDHLRWHTRNKPGGKEGVCATHDSERQILDAYSDKTVAANRLHVDVHVPEEDAEAHEGEERDEHEAAE